MFKIFVGNLNFTTTEDAVRLLFARHAEVNDVAMPVDPETGKHRGFAIIMIKDEIRAKGAMIALRGSRLDGRALVINAARKKGDPVPPKRERSSSRVRARGGSRPSRGSYGGGGGGGGYGGSRDRGASGSSGGSSGYSSRPQRSYGSGPNWKPEPPRDDRGNSGPPRPRED